VLVNLERGVRLREGGSRGPEERGTKGYKFSRLFQSGERKNERRERMRKIVYRDAANENAKNTGNGECRTTADPREKFTEKSCLSYAGSREKSSMKMQQKRGKRGSLTRGRNVSLSLNKGKKRGKEREIEKETVAEAGRSRREK